MFFSIDKSAVLAAFAHAFLVAGTVCAQPTSLADEPADTFDQPLVATLAPGETHTYHVALPAGRHHVAALEMGIDVELVVAIGEILYAADSPTARFALEQVWFETAEGAEAAVRVTALRPAGVSAGDYRLEVRSNYEASQERRAAERQTTDAMRTFNASYAEGLSPEERMSQRRSTLDAYTSTAELWERLGEPATAAYCWHAAGFISSALLREQPRARSYLDRAASNYRSSNLGDHELVAEKDIAQSLRREGRLRDASLQLEKIEALGTEAASRLAFIGGVAGNDLCLIHQELGEFDRARSHCEQALETFSNLGETIEFNNTLHNLAIVESLSGNQDAAIARLYDLLERHEAIGEPVRYAQSLSLLVNSLFEAGDIDAALSAYDQAVTVFEQEGMQRWLAATLARYSRIEQILGRHDEARLHLHRALELAKAENSARWEGVVKVALAEIDLTLGQPESAIESLNDAVDTFQRSQRFDSLLSARIKLAEALLIADRPLQANTIVERIEQEGDVPAALIGSVLLTRARILAAQEQTDRAIALARRAKQAFEDRGNLIGQLQAAELEAEYLIQQERWGEALALVESQRERVQRVGRSLVLPELKARYFSQQQRFYETLVSVYGRTAESTDAGLLKILNASEEARATALRAHLETASSSWLESTRPTLRTEYSRARQRVNQLIQENLGTDVSASDEMVDALHALERIQNRIWRENTQIAELVDEQPIAWPRIDQLLDERTAVLYVFAGLSEKFAVLLQKGQRTRYPLTLQRSIDAVVRELLAEVSSPNTLFGARSPAARSLTGALFEPIVEQLQEIDRLVIVPDGGLHNVPISALPHPSSGRPLVETHEISIVASLRAALQYDIDSAVRSDKYTVAAVGDPVTDADDPRLEKAPGTASPGLPRLYGSRRELERLRDLAGAANVVLHTGFEARKTLFLENRMPNVDILHVAAHGISSETTAARSGIFLSTIDEEGRAIDGHLGLTDLFGVELDVPLVVLSGCETALGETMWSEGPIGIARAFQYAGVPNVVSTLWRIDDSASAILVGAFYKHLGSDESVPSALRLAQLEMMQDVNYRHPYYWAAFQSLGNWTLRWTAQQKPAAGAR